MGTVKTLVLNAKLEIAPVEQNGEKAPGYRVYSDGSEVGAGGEKTSEQGTWYLSLKLDGPAPPAPTMPPCSRTKTPINIRFFGSGPIAVSLSSPRHPASPEAGCFCVSQNDTAAYIPARKPQRKLPRSKPPRGCERNTRLTAPTLPFPFAIEIFEQCGVPALQILHGGFPLILSGNGKPVFS